VHLKHALHLEDEERFKEAEEEFIKANKPREAVEMYIHQQDWDSAMAVAEKYDPSAVPDVCVAEGRAAAERGDHAKAEEHFISASKPELALTMYQEARMWPEAIRVAQRHLPHRLAEVNMAYQGAQAQLGKGGGKVDYLSAGRTWEESRSWNQAIDIYLNARKDVMPNADDLEEIWDRCARRGGLSWRRTNASSLESQQGGDDRQDSRSGAVLGGCARSGQAPVRCGAVRGGRGCAGSGRPDRGRRRVVRPWCWARRLLRRC
jgi:tetratricopeptide (TPR) repeat protein